MPRKSLGPTLLVVGAVFCIPAAVVVFYFAQGMAALDALETAPKCATPTQDSRANCRSLFNGKITSQSRTGKGGRTAMVAMADSALVVEVNYAGPSSMDEGSDVITEWWRGKLVRLGPVGAPPTFTTVDSPQHQVEAFGFLLVSVIPGASLLLAGLLAFQAPMSADELMTTSIARWPDPPRPIDRTLAWRVAWRSFAPGATFFVWLFLYFFPMMALEIIGEPRYASWLLIATFVVSFGVTAVLTAGYLSDLARMSEKRTIVVQKLQSGLGRAGTDTKIWYELKDSRVGTKVLQQPWYGHVNEGDRLDTLTDPKSGKILRVLSTPPS
jgi:hypothetical protein